MSRNKEAKIKLTEFLTGKVQKDLYQKALNFSINYVNIISLKDNPVSVRAIILENEREFHLVINQKKGEIFHDCPSFLIHSEKEKKLCFHLIKVILMLSPEVALQIIKDFDKFTFTSEDFGSKKKSKNFLILANQCFEKNICVEGLNYLNKAIINQNKCGEIINNYLEIAIKNELFIEFFEFLKMGYENELNDYFLKYTGNIQKGFRLFLSSIPVYSFYDLLRIIKSIDKIFKHQDLNFMGDLSDKFQNMILSENFNKIYFALYFVKKNLSNLSKINPKYSELLSHTSVQLFKANLIEYFFNEIDNFSVVEKLKLMKKQFEVIGIPQNRYLKKYKLYKLEIKELEKKVYFKKFSFMKVLMEKYSLKKARGEFKKQRNTYIVSHDYENLEKPVYHYIIRRLGFFGLNDQTIKSTDIGINYFIMKELFSDDLTSPPDIAYYRKQFWGNLNDITVNAIDGLILMSNFVQYGYDIDHRYSNISELIIIEWDLANKPRHVSIVNAHGSKIMIPDQNNPLFHDLKPFDLCYCLKAPVKIEGDIIKTINVITKCSFKDAINSVSKGMEFIEGYYPLSIVKSVLNKEINPFEAYESITSNPNRSFVPNYNQFVKAFRNFLFEFIKEQKEYIFQELKSDPENKTNQFLILLNLRSQLNGIDLNYSNLISDLLSSNISIPKFKSRFIEAIHSSIDDFLNNPTLGSTSLFNITLMKNTPFFKYSNRIIEIRKKEFELKKVKRFEDTYNIGEIRKTYYGKKILNLLKLSDKPTLKQEEYNAFAQAATKLGLKIDIL